MRTKIQGYVEFFIIWGVVGGVVFSLSSVLAVSQVNPLSGNHLEPEGGLSLIQGNSVIPNVEYYLPKIDNPIDSNVIRVVVTAYSSSPTETDDDPFITASGEWVHDGVVAANFLPFGTEIRIPEIYGNKIFVIKDRMHPRKTQQVDIWFSSKQEALNFGAHYSYIEVLDI